MKSEIVFGLEDANWPALLADSTGAVRKANPAAIRAFGPAGKAELPPLSALWSPENETSMEKFLAGCEQTVLAPVKLRGQNGQTANFICSACTQQHDKQKFFVLQFFPENVPAKPAGAATEKNVTSDAVAQKQKLDCALQLARNVSLDFNNALTSILGHTSLILSQIEPNHPWHNSLIEVEKSAAKAAEIANDLGTFSRQEKEARAQTVKNLNQLLKRTVELFQGTNEKTIAWSQQWERKLYAAKFDEAKMQQVFLKVLENSVQAISGSEGRISVQSRNMDLTEPTQDRNAQLAAGCYVCVEISDNGCGIAPDVLPRIFEPFFTTKRGNHRGLGLAWVYGIVTNHGGGVAVSSQSDVGTSVRVYLPAENKFVTDFTINPKQMRGDQTILMVDDEDLLLTMGQTILSSFGYHVLTANSGQRALEIIAKTETHIDLVITDLVMPTMSGRELMERIAQISPDTQIICTSGYVWPASKVDESRYLQKPFTSQELLMKVKRAFALETTSVD